MKTHSEEGGGGSESEVDNAPKEETLRRDAVSPQDHQGRDVTVSTPHSAEAKP